MDMNKYSRIKELYDKGFRCIRYEDGQHGELKVYLKNFEEEMIDSIICTDPKEIQQIRNFIDTN